MYEQRFMDRALVLSATASSGSGTEPFAAVVVRDGLIVGEGVNHARAHLDPTSHGEIEAIRDACRRLRRIDLSGCVLYSSCEPCALCVAAMHIVGIRRLFHASSLAQSEAALAGVPPERRPRVDVDALRHAAGAPAASCGLEVEQHRADEAVRIIAAWAETQQP